MNSCEASRTVPPLGQIVDDSTGPMPDLLSMVRKVMLRFFTFWNSHAGSRSLRLLPPDSLLRPHHRGRDRLAYARPHSQHRRPVVGRPCTYSPFGPFEDRSSAR